MASRQFEPDLGYSGVTGGGPAAESGRVRLGEVQAGGREGSSGERHEHTRQL